MKKSSLNEMTSLGNTVQEKGWKRDEKGQQKCCEKCGETIYLLFIIKLILREGVSRKGSKEGQKGTKKILWKKSSSSYVFSRSRRRRRCLSFGRRRFSLKLQRSRRVENLIVVIVRLEDSDKSSVDNELSGSLLVFFFFGSEETALESSLISSRIWQETKRSVKVGANHGYRSLEKYAHGRDSHSTGWHKNLTVFRIEVLLETHPLPGAPGVYGEFEAGVTVQTISRARWAFFTGREGVEGEGHTNFCKRSRTSNDGPFKIVRTREEVDIQWVRTVVSSGLPMSFFYNKEVRKAVLMTSESIDNYIRTGLPMSFFDNKEVRKTVHIFLLPPFVKKQFCPGETVFRKGVKKNRYFFFPPFRSSLTPFLNTTSPTQNSLFFYKKNPKNKGSEKESHVYKKHEKCLHQVWWRSPDLRIPDQRTTIHQWQ